VSRMEVHRPHMRDGSATFRHMSMAPGPEAMRSAMAEYVAAVHRAYLEAAATLTPADRGRLPLVRSSPFTVVAVGARNLHVIGTSDHLPAVTGPEVEVFGEEGDLRWHLRFYDPVVQPAIGLIDEGDAPQPAQVRSALGISGVVYHLTVPPGGGLSAHHALHAGTGLAHSHAAAARDYETLTHLVPAQSGLVQEMKAAEAMDLPASVLLLARHIAPGDDALAQCDPLVTPAADTRRRLLGYLRGTT